jgi:hypothetical protein
MQYLPPDTYKVWKSQLRQGLVSTATATQVGERLARVHATFAKSATAPDEFDTDAIFHSLRIEPYLLATARAHPDLASVFEALAETTARTKITVVHGDVSPKNILVGPAWPRVSGRGMRLVRRSGVRSGLRLNHLLLKTMWVPAGRRGSARGVQCIEQSLSPRR